MSVTPVQDSKEILSNLIALLAPGPFFSQIVLYTDTLLYTDSKMDEMVKRSVKLLRISAKKDFRGRDRRSIVLCSQRYPSRCAANGFDVIYLRPRRFTEPFEYLPGVKIVTPAAMDMVERIIEQTFQEDFTFCV